MTPSVPNDDLPPAPRDAAPAPELLRAQGISKRFGITQALDNVTVSFAAGEVHALMGENGAGKSTLGKVLAGLHTQDSGTVRIYEGRAWRALEPGSIDDAFDAGIRIVHQELAQCPNLTVAENLCLHDIPRSRLGLVNRRAMEDRAARLLARLEPGIDPRARLGALAPGRRQIVQIAASLDAGPPEAHDTPHARGPRVIVFDEPTSSLSLAEVERLLAIIRRLAADGLTCIYVSHRMGEIFAVADRATVLRDGALVATTRVKDLDEATLVEQMVGRSVSPSTRRERRPATDNPPALEVKNLSSPGTGGTPIHAVSLNVAPGEILGIGGLVGAGRSELLDALFGLDRHAAGSITAAGRALTRASRHLGPQASIAAGIGYIPEDRKLQGLFFQLGVGENLVMPFMHRLARALGVRNVALETRHATDKMREFLVKSDGTHARPASLSGGNQQKLLAARWMGREARVLLLDEPTRGIDVGAKQEIHRLIRDAAGRGAAVVLVSSEMPELLALSDRILVLADGRVAGELSADQMTQTNILRLAAIEQPEARPVANAH